MPAKKLIYYIWIALLISMIVLSCKSDVTRTSNNGMDQKTKEQSVQKFAVSDDNPRSFFERAEFYYDQSDYDGAIADLQAAIKLDSLKPDYYHLLSDSYMDYYRSKKALMTMEEAAELFPDRIATLLKLSEIQLILQQYEPSLITVSKILSREPNNPDGHFMKGMNFRAMGEVEKAIGAFQTTTELRPDYIDAWLIAGDLFDQKGSKLALDYYEAAINADPKNPTALHSKAYYLQNNGNDNEAIRIYKKINSIDKNYLDAYLNTGILYMSMDSLDKAMEQFNIMASLKPQNHLPYYYRGLIYEAQGDLGAARSELQNCLNLKSDFSKAKVAINNLSAS